MAEAVPVETRRGSAMKATNEQIIAAYRRTGSVWKAAKELGMGGQTVHERLRALGYRLFSSKWTKEEEAELAALVGQCTIGEIARRLARPYAGVAMKISKLGLAGSAAPRQRKIPRGAGFDKVAVLKHMRALERYKGKVTTYARQGGLDIELLVSAIQKVDLAWWDRYTSQHSNLPHRDCPYCGRGFTPFTAKQVHCTRVCSDTARRDTQYFGGKRRQTIGLAEKVCQLCERENPKALSAHHVIGKGEDSQNDFLVALCPGCHHLIGILAGRAFTDSEQGWENLINLVILRRRGWGGGGYHTWVDIDELTRQDIEDDIEDESPLRGLEGGVKSFLNPELIQPSSE